MVKEFCILADLPMHKSPTWLPVRHPWAALIKEEYEEYLQAVDDHSTEEVADALADLLYVVYGTAIAHGIPIDEVLEEVHRSNMSKLPLDGTPPVRRADGKILKPDSFSPPDIERVLLEHGGG